MSSGSPSRLDRGPLLQFFGGPFLGCFSVTTSFSSDNSWSGMIDGMTESRPVVRLQPETVMVDWNTLWKMLIFSPILLAPSNVFSGSVIFSVTSGFLNSVSQMGSVVGNSGSLLDVAVWLEVTWDGRIVAVKMIA